MKRIVLQIFICVSGLLMLFRFGAQALIFGATGPGPFGNRWLPPGTKATLLLDADLRFLGAMMIGLGVIFFWAIARVEALGSATIVIEAVIPIVLVLLRYYVGKEVKKS